MISKVDINVKVKSIHNESKFFYYMYFKSVHMAHTDWSLLEINFYSHARKFHKNLLVKNIQEHKPVQFIQKCLLRLYVRVSCHKPVLYGILHSIILHKKIYQAYDIDYLHVHHMLFLYLKNPQFESVTVKQEWSISVCFIFLYFKLHCDSNSRYGT